MNVRVEGDPRPVPPGVDLSAYRIIQEALTNSLKHAGRAEAEVTLRYAPASLELEIVDNGSASDATVEGAGHGLIGMRERVALYGGSLDDRRPQRPRLRRARDAPAQPERRMSIRVLIADDQALVRTGFRVILDAEPDIDVVGEAGDGRAAVDAARALRPDVVLMDIRMPELDGIEATRLLAQEARSPRVLILTTFDLDEYVYEALRAGASGFLLKDAGADELLHAVRVVAGGRGAALALDHAPADRGLRAPAAAPRAARRARRADTARARGAAPDRPRPLERRDRPPRSWSATRR